MGEENYDKITFGPVVQDKSCITEAVIESGKKPHSYSAVIRGVAVNISFTDDGKLKEVSAEVFPENEPGHNRDMKVVTGHLRRYPELLVDDNKVGEKESE